jgi:hypothetical protein
MLPVPSVATTLPVSSHRFATMLDAGAILPMSVLVPFIPLAQEHVIETAPSVIEPVNFLAADPFPCHVPSINAKLVLTGVCDLISACGRVRWCLI